MADRLLALLFAVALASGGLPSSGAAVAVAPPFAVDVTLRETAGVARSGELVTFGVPVAASAGLLTTSGLRVASGGTPRPAQFRVTSRWGGPPSDVTKPARWLLVDTLADLPANGTATIQVGSGGAGGPGAMAVSEDAAAVTVDTGAGVYRVSKTAGSVLASARSGGQELLDTDDPANGFRVATPDGDVLLSRSDADVLATSVTETGTVKTVVHQSLEFDDARLKDEAAETWSANACFTWLYDCGELRRYRLRVSTWTTFVRDSAAVRVRARTENVSVCPVTEDGAKHCWLEHSLNSSHWDDLSLHLGLAAPATTWESGAATGPAATGVSAYQDSSGLATWDYYKNLPPVGDNGYTPGGWDRYGAFVDFRGYRTSVAGTPGAAGDRMSGWLALHGGTRTAAVAVADAWKHYPVALRGAVGGGAVEAGLYPGEFAAAHSMRPGERKTHEVGLLLGAGSPGGAQRMHAWVEEPVRWAWGPAYALSTGALPGFALHGLEADLDLWNRATVDVSVSEAHAPGWWASSSVVENREEYDHWGKKEAGFLVNDNEAETATDLSKYSQYQGFLRQALATATADPALSDVWWDLAVDANRAQADAGYLMQPYADPENLYRGINIAHCFHDNSENKTYPRGGGFGCDFAGDVDAMAELWLLTGWEPAADAVEAHTDNVARRAADLADYDREARRFGSWMQVLVTAWELYGDHRYLDLAVGMADTAAAGDATHYLDCPCPEDPPNAVGVNSNFAGWLLRSLGRTADALDANGEGAGAAAGRVKSLLAAHAAWYADKVVFAAPNPNGTGETEWVGPYMWYTNDTTGNNTDPTSAGYRLMAVDGLALAAKHTGDPRYLDVAGNLFRTVMKMPFYWGGWPQFLYSTINDAGKLATFGGYYVTAAHGAEPPSATGTVALELADLGTGASVYSHAGSLTSGGYDVVANGWGQVASVTGTGTLAGVSGGEATVALDVRRLWILPLCLGSVRVTDAGGGVDATTTFFLGDVAPAQGGAVVRGALVDFGAWRVYGVTATVG